MNLQGFSTRLSSFLPGYTTSLFIILLVCKSVLYSHIQIVFPESDSFSYLICTMQMDDGGLPLFFMRPPGYPLFILIVWNLFGVHYKAIVVIQMLLSASGWSILYFGISKHLKHPLWIWIFIASLALIPVFAITDWFILSESVALSLLLITFGMLAYYLHHSGTVNLLITSLAATAAFLVKLALFPILLIIPAILFIGNPPGQRFQTLGRFLIIPLIILTGLSFYNRNTIDTFSIMSFGQFNRLISVMHILQPDDSDDPRMKAAITHTIPKIQYPSATLFTHTPQTEFLYQENAKRIYDLEAELSQNSGMMPWEIYSLCGPIWSKSVLRSPMLFGNFLWNNAILYITNTRQFVGSPTVKLQQHIQMLKSDPLLIPANLKTNASINELMIPIQTCEVNFPVYIEWLFMVLNKLFRHMIYWLLVPVAIAFITFKLIPSPIDLFLLALLGFILMYSGLVIYSSNAALDRYSIYSDICLYLSIPLLYEGYKQKRKQR